MIADEAIKPQGFKKPAILADSTNYGQLGREDLEKALAAKGVKPVAEEKFNIGDTDMTAQLLRAKEAGADVILTYGIGPELAQIANGMAKLGWKVPMIGSWTLSMATFIDTAGAERRRRDDAADLHPAADHAEAQGLHRGLPGGLQDRPHAVAGLGRAGLRLGLSAGRRDQAGRSRPTAARSATRSKTCNTKVEGVVTDLRPARSRATDHEAITANIPVFGLVKGGRVVPAHPEDVAGRQGRPHQAEELSRQRLSQASAPRSRPRASSAISARHSELRPMQILAQLIVSGIAVGMIYGVIAFGYQLTFATSKTLNFGQGEALMLGALVGLTRSDRQAIDSATG